MALLNLPTWVMNKAFEEADDVRGNDGPTATPKAVHNATLKSTNVVQAT